MSFIVYGDITTNTSADVLLYGEGDIISAKYIKLQGDGMSDTYTTLSSTQTSNKLLNLPNPSNSSDVLCSITSSDIFKNKNLTDVSNKIISLGSRTISDNVIYFNSSSPTSSNQVLVTTGSDTTSWIPYIGSSDVSILLSDLANTGVIAGTYGSLTTVARVTINSDGKITYVSDVTIAGGVQTTLTSTGGITLVSDSLGPNLSIKGLNIGSGLAISDLGTSLSLNATATATTLTSGGGTSLVSNGSGLFFSVKGITAGTNIIISDLGTNLSINTPSITLSSAGGTFSIVCDSLGPALSVKGPTPGQGMGLSDIGNDISVAITRTMTNGAGGALNIVNDGNVLTGYKIKGFTAGAGISISDVGNFLNITNLNPTIPTLTSAGGTFTLVSDSQGPIMSVKGLNAGLGIAISDLDTSLSIHNLNTTISTLTSAGGTFILVSDSLGPTLSIKGITAGNNISITDSGLALTINTPTTTLTSAGGTFTLVSDSLGLALSVKGLNAGVGITISDLGTSLSINALAVTNPTLTSAGGTFTLVSDSLGPDISIKGLTAGNNILISDSGTFLTISTTTSDNSINPSMPNINAGPYGVFTYNVTSGISVGSIFLNWFRYPLNTTIISGGVDNFGIGIPPTLSSERVRLHLNGKYSINAYCTFIPTNQQNFGMYLFSSNAGTNTIYLNSGRVNGKGKNPHNLSLSCIYNKTSDSNQDIEMDFINDNSNSVTSFKYNNYVISDANIISGSATINGERTTTFFNNGSIRSQSLGYLTIYYLG